MLAQVPYNPPPPNRTAGAAALARRRAADLEAALMLALLVLVGLVWLVIGGAVMRGARDAATRAEASLQRGLADVEAVASD